MSDFDGIYVGKIIGGKIVFVFDLVGKFFFPLSYNHSGKNILYCLRGAGGFWYFLV